MAKNFSREVVSRLLDGLANDDQFRELFQSDPRAALAQIGHVTPEADVGKEGVDPVVCCTGRLASKEEIRRSAELLRERLSSVPFSFSIEI